MPQKPRLALYEHEIEIYIANMVTNKGTPASDTEKQKTRKALADITALLNERGHSWPDAGDYDTYSGGHNDKTTKQNVSRIEKFFAWLKGRKIDRMPENEITATLDAENSQPELFPADDTQDIEASASTTNDTEDEPMQAAKKKPGRKVFDAENGEKKSEKLMLYLTPALITRIRTWCDLKGISAVSYITTLIEEDLDSKQEKISAFLDMRNNL